MKFEVRFKNESDETLAVTKFEKDSLQELSEEIKKLLDQDYITIQQRELFGTIIVSSKIAKVSISHSILP
ncbi:hypothetical protein [Rummeliibacillus pycnus]|uniref:hypothetical protein n=1 Tax=Rummeliibacillus pycnus TaxID=101070 RepID=UPI003D2BCF41